MAPTKTYLKKNCFLPPLHHDYSTQTSSGSENTFDRLMQSYEERKKVTRMTRSKTKSFLISFSFDQENSGGLQSGRVSKKKQPKKVPLSHAETSTPCTNIKTIKKAVANNITLSPIVNGNKDITTNCRKLRRRNIFIGPEKSNFQSGVSSFEVSNQTSNLSEKASQKRGESEILIEDTFDLVESNDVISNVSSDNSSLKPKNNSPVFDDSPQIEITENSVTKSYSCDVSTQYPDETNSHYYKSLKPPGGDSRTIDYNRLCDTQQLEQISTVAVEDTKDLVVNVTQLNIDQLSQLSTITVEDTKELEAIINIAQLDVSQYLNQSNQNNEQPNCFTPNESQLFTVTVEDTKELEAIVNVAQLDVNQYLNQPNQNKEQSNCFTLNESQLFTVTVEDTKDLETTKHLEAIVNITPLDVNQYLNQSNQNNEQSNCFTPNKSQLFTVTVEDTKDLETTKHLEAIVNITQLDIDPYLNQPNLNELCVNITQMDINQFLNQPEHCFTPEKPLLTQSLKEAVVNITQLDVDQFNTEPTQKHDEILIRRTLLDAVTYIDISSTFNEKEDTVSDLMSPKGMVLKAGKDWRRSYLANRRTTLNFNRMSTTSMLNEKENGLNMLASPKVMVLKAGKDWRRSYLANRRMTASFGCRQFDDENSASLANRRQSIVCACIQCKKNTRLSVKVVPLSPIRNARDRGLSCSDNFAAPTCPGYVSNGGDETDVFNGYLDHLSLRDDRDGYALLQEDKRNEEQRERPVTPRDAVLKKCKQSEPLPFEKCYPNSILQNCQKIGEGVYGEVFLFRNPSGGVTVIKIVPIEGSLIVNGERQKRFEEVLSEITIQKELTDLREGNSENRTGSFSQLQRVMCVKGRYPRRLLELWELFEEMHGTQNDSPEAFGDDQLYIVFELANGGNDMESYAFGNSVQAYSLFKQIACTLAVAEVTLEFEHRDLHWGNILVTAVNPRTSVVYQLNGKKIEVATHGVQVTIIDYTLSRIKHNGICIYNDLSMDPDLFTADGDYQFDIYRLMKESNKDDWQKFEPYTNVLWLHYILDKMITALRYRNKQSQKHRMHIQELECLHEKILSFKSSEDFVTKVLMEK